MIAESGAGDRPIKIEVEAAGNVGLEEIYGDEPTRDLDGKILKTGRALFTEALDLVETCAATVAERIDSMGARKPDEVELQLAIKVDGKAGARIVELTAGAQIQVCLRWKTQADAP
ncbi:CU044_2847 family protein [Catenuloplanes japonicus]|uniref:CU044_2847 family protein n=1 Tax=Catenuloplanes japonicus TaxID=33876 RepID=UPI00068BDCD0|nr:CU044_2847 family protein [Catenuloplanes japonicus]